MKEKMQVYLFWVMVFFLYTFGSAYKVKEKEILESYNKCKELCKEDLFFCEKACKVDLDWIFIGFVEPHRSAVFHSSEIMDLSNGILRVWIKLMLTEKGKEYYIGEIINGLIEKWEETYGPIEESYGMYFVKKELYKELASLRKKYEKLAYIISLEEIDCYKKMHRCLEIRALNTYGKIIERTTSSYVWDHMDPDEWNASKWLCEEALEIHSRGTNFRSIFGLLYGIFRSLRKIRKK
jgi:hypothetical protein